MEGKERYIAVVTYFFFAEEGRSSLSFAAGKKQHQNGLVHTEG